MGYIQSSGFSHVSPSSPQSLPLLCRRPLKLGRSELAERCAWEGGEFAERPRPESLPPRAAEPEERRRRVRAGSGRTCAAPPGLGVCRPSLPRPARRRPCGSRGSRGSRGGGGGGGPGARSSPGSRAAGSGRPSPCPAASRAPRGRRPAGAPAAAAAGSWGGGARG
ncbi:unnamed protein product [Nyctereutes procyonoides]|uniref:(raccoon dog) hypothetical protein n=1 Tax=Nyctereutes procyonoides TaxID=34880 RepID=A0A811Y148_NYCPR|nr:unnamed protein product [Nyctereutes procyonoides]